MKKEAGMTPLQLILTIAILLIIAGVAVAMIFVNADFFKNIKNENNTTLTENNKNNEEMVEGQESPEDLESPEEPEGLDNPAESEGEEAIYVDVTEETE